MSKAKIYKKKVGGKTEYWLSTKGYFDDLMPEDFNDILVHIYSAIEESAWTKKKVHKKVNLFEKEMLIKHNGFRLPEERLKIVLKNGKVIELNRKK